MPATQIPPEIAIKQPPPTQPTSQEPFYATPLRDRPPTNRTPEISCLAPLTFIGRQIQDRVKPVERSRRLTCIHEPGATSAAPIGAGRASAFARAGLRAVASASWSGWRTLQEPSVLPSAAVSDQRSIGPARASVGDDELWLKYCGRMRLGRAALVAATVAVAACGSQTRSSPERHAPTHVSLLLSTHTAALIGPRSVACSGAPNGPCLTAAETRLSGGATPSRTARWHS